MENLYILDPYANNLYGEDVRSQIEHNEHCRTKIATDTDCMVDMGAIAHQMLPNMQFAYKCLL